MDDLAQKRSAGSSRRNKLRKNLTSYSSEAESKSLMWNFSWKFGQERACPLDPKISQLEIITVTLTIIIKDPCIALFQFNFYDCVKHFHVHKLSLSLQKTAQLIGFRSKIQTHSPNAQKPSITSTVRRVGSHCTYKTDETKLCAELTPATDTRVQKSKPCKE